MTESEHSHSARPSSEHGVEAGALYVVATPIGNLGDVTLRAIDVLKSVDAIAAEDTRHSRTLLDHHGIGTRLFAVHEHNERSGARRVIDMLSEGKSVAMITDAGTPAISDPGALVVAAVLEAGLRVVPIPGASAIVAALSASGTTAPGFSFAGFVPVKSGQRQAAFQSFSASELALVFYEAPHRIVESMSDVAAVFGSERPVTICRELTKRFESIHRCAAGDAVEWLQADDNRRRGEFVVIVEGIARAEGEADDTEVRRVLTVLLEELPTKQAAALAAKITGMKKNELYDLALRLQEKK
jgi:16S rRNA (cytidine1402-2'-O)-methyltransferase